MNLHHRIFACVTILFFVVFCVDMEAQEEISFEDYNLFVEFQIEAVHAMTVLLVLYNAYEAQIIPYSTKPKLNTRSLEDRNIYLDVFDDRDVSTSDSNISAHKLLDSLQSGLASEANLELVTAIKYCHKELNDLRFELQSIYKNGTYDKENIEYAEEIFMSVEKLFALHEEKVDELHANFSSSFVFPASTSVFDSIQGSIDKILILILNKDYNLANNEMVELGSHLQELYFISSSNLSQNTIVRIFESYEDMIIAFDKRFKEASLDHEISKDDFAVKFHNSICLSSLNAISPGIISHLNKLYKIEYPHNYRLIGEYQVIYKLSTKG